MLIGGGLQASIVVLQNLIVDVVRILFQHTHHGGRIDKARDIIDMSVRIIASNTLP